MSLKEELLPVLIDTISDILGVDPSEILLETDLVDDFNMETLVAVQIIVALEKRYGVRIDVRRARRARTVAEILDMLEELVRTEREASTG